MDADIAERAMAYMNIFRFFLSEKRLAVTMNRSRGSKKYARQIPKEENEIELGIIAMRATIKMVIVSQAKGYGILLPSFFWIEVAIALKFFINQAPKTARIITSNKVDGRGPMSKRIRYAGKAATVVVKAISSLRYAKQKKARPKNIANIVIISFQL